MVRTRRTNPVVRRYELFTRSWARRNADWAEDSKSGSLVKWAIWELTLPIYAVSVVGWYLWRVVTYPLMWFLDKIW